MLTEALDETRTNLATGHETRAHRPRVMIHILRTHRYDSDRLPIEKNLTV